MDTVVSSFGFLGGLLYVALIILWICVPIFVFLISRRVKQMRDISRESGLEVKEMNANLKYLKQRFSDANESD